MPREKIGFWEAFSIGVGGMIGGGIFAVLGLSIQLSKSAAPIAFLLAGIVALTTAYSYAKLSLRFPSEGGTIEFLVKAYGTGILSGGLNVLLLASYIVMISLYAYAFGSYGANIFGSTLFAKHVLISFVIILFTFVNALGAVISGRTEDALVGFKLAILITVAGAGLLLVNPSKLAPSHWADPISIIAGGMIIFLAYEGFELIANTGNDVEDPRVLPKAFYASVILVIVIYVLVAIVTVGNLPYSVIIKSRDYALATAAEPSLGMAGFWLVTLAALASTSSAINATLYGTARASYMVAKYGQLPKAVERPLWKQAYEGLIMIGIFSLILANTASLESISTAGSGGFLLVFLAVNLAALRLKDKMKIRTAIPAVGAILSFVALVILVFRMIQTDVMNLTIFIGLLVASFAIEIAYRAITGREIREYVDERLKQKEDSIRNWHQWINDVVVHLRRAFEDAEIYLVGSLARGEVEKAHDVDILVLTSKKPEKEVVKKIKREAGIAPQTLDIHVEHKAYKDEVLRKAKHYRPL